MKVVHSLNRAVRVVDLRPAKAGRLILTGIYPNAALAERHVTISGQMLDDPAIIWPATVETVLAELRRRGFTEERLQRIFTVSNGRKRPGVWEPIFPARRPRKRRVAQRDDPPGGRKPSGPYHGT